MRLRLCVPASLAVVLVTALFACSSDDGGSASGGIVINPDASSADVADIDPQPGVDDSLAIPCEPRAVLKAICQQCHTRPLKNGAPFPLQRLSDINAVHFGRLTRLDMIDDLNAGRMPLFPVTISATDKKTLLDWLNDGAPAVSPRSCLVEQEDAGSIEDAGDAG